MVNQHMMDAPYDDPLYGAPITGCTNHLYTINLQTGFHIYTALLLVVSVISWTNALQGLASSGSKTRLYQTSLNLHVLYCENMHGSLRDRRRSTWSPKSSEEISYNRHLSTRCPFSVILRGEKLNYKSVAKEIWKPPFFGSWSPVGTESLPCLFDSRFL